MGSRLTFALLFAVAIIPGMLGAYSMKGVDSLLSGYSVPNSLVSSLSPVNLTLAGSSYVALYKGGALYFLVNVTRGNYSLVTNASSIYSVIRNRTISAALAQANPSALSAQMKRYQASSAQPLGDCLFETGLSQGATCTMQNNCASCQSIPVCFAAMFNNSEILEPAIQTFASQYAWMNQSFNEFYSAANSLSAGNANAKIPIMNAAFLNITNLTENIYQNALFSPPSNFTSTSFSSCNYAANPSTLPWYCVAIGFCMNPTYNYTKLAYINSGLSALGALPISNNQVLAIATNTSSTENGYVATIIAGQKRAQLSAMLNSTIPGYAALVSSSASVLARIPNQALLNALTAFEATYAGATANYSTANITAEGVTLASEYAALKGAYAAVNGTYSSLISNSSSNTAKLIELQLGGSSSQEIGNLAFEQFSLNSAIASGGSANILALNAEEASISRSLSSYYVSPVDLVGIARYFDGPFVTLIAPALGLGYSSAVSLAPALGALLSLIIGAVVFALLFVYRSRLHSHHKVALNRKTRRNWNIVFALLAALILVYAGLTALLVSYANASAPIGAFNGALKSSGSLVVVLNGTATQAMQSCAGKIEAQAQLEGKKIIQATFSDGICSADNITASEGTCMGTYADRGTPMVILTSATSPGIGVYSLYGTELMASGSDAVMGTCYVSSLIG